MKYTDINGKKLSALSLGTVQLGMNYGIANTLGKPSEERSFDMLRTALSSGITSIDTAKQYGDSENVIGAFFRTWEGELPFITTKLWKIEGESEAEVEKYIVSSAEAALERLGVSRVNNIMLHVTTDISEHGARAAKAMRSLVDRGYTDLVGASIYVEEDINNMLLYPEYDSIQVPMSIFDQRLIKSGSIEKLSNAGVTVFVRSVFLQGVFFLDPDKLTDPIMVEQVKPRLYLLREYAEKEEMSVAQLAIAFIRDLPGVASLVLGADTSDQVRDNIACVDTKPISEETRAALERDFADVDIPKIMQVLSRPKN